MDNYYEESTVLDVDPCYDTFIQSMEGIGYDLVADVVLPDGGPTFGHWTASCNFRSEMTSALVSSSTTPFMAPGQTLAPPEHIYGWSHFIDIGGRKAIVTPPAEGYKSCMLSMTTEAGSLSVIGHALVGGIAPSMDPCVGVEDLARQIEPWIED